MGDALDGGRRWLRHATGPAAGEVSGGAAPRASPCAPACSIAAPSSTVVRSGGRTSVPQIFVDGRHLGNCEELYALEAAGKLGAILEGAE